MKNADLPAMPITEEPFPAGAVSERYGPLMFGLTKREMFAMHFHAALLTAQNQNGDWTGVSAGAADFAVIEADNLLAALDRKEDI